MDSSTTTLDLKSSNTFKMPTSEKTQNSQQNGTNYSNTSDVLEFKTIETEYTFEELLQVADKGIELNAQDDTWAVSYIQTTVDFLMRQEQNFADQKFVSTLNRVIEAYNNASGNRKALFEQYFPEQYAYFKWISNEYLNNFMPANKIIARIKSLETIDISIDTIEYIDDLLNMCSSLTPEQNKYLPENFEETTISQIIGLKEQLEKIKLDVDQANKFSNAIIPIINQMAKGKLTDVHLTQAIEKIEARFFGIGHCSGGFCFLSDNAIDITKETYVKIDGKDVSIYDLYLHLKKTKELYYDNLRLERLYEDRDRNYRFYLGFLPGIAEENARIDAEIRELETKWGIEHRLTTDERFEKNPLGFIFSCVMAPVYGALDIVEGVIDLAIYASGGLCAGVTYLFDDDLAQDFLDTAQMMIEYDLTGAAYALNMEIVGIDEDVYNNSIASGAMVGGKLVGMAIITMVCPPAGAALITSSSLAGSAIEEAFLNGATYGEAGVIGAVTWTTSFVSGYVTNITTNYVIGISAAVLEPFFTSTFEYICYMDHVDENGNPVYKSLWDYYEKDGTYMDASLAALFAIWEVRQNKKKPPKGTTSKTTEVDNTTGGSKNLDDVLDDTTVKADTTEVTAKGDTPVVNANSSTKVNGIEPTIEKTTGFKENAVISELQIKFPDYDLSNYDFDELKRMFPDEIDAITKRQYKEIVLEAKRGNAIEYNINGMGETKARAEWDLINGNGSFDKLSYPEQAKLIESAKLGIAPEGTEEYLKLLEDYAEDVANTTISNIETLKITGKLKPGVEVDDVLRMIQDDIDPSVYLTDDAILEWKQAWRTGSKAPDGMINTYTFQAENKGVLTFNSVGRAEGAFAITESQYNWIMDPKNGIFDANGVCQNRAALTKITGGVDFGSGNIVCVKQTIPEDALKMASGNLNGAFTGDWCPGGKTSNGAIEGITPSAKVTVENSTVTGNTLTATGQVNVNGVDYNVTTEIKLFGSVGSTKTTFDGNDILTLLKK